MNVMKMEDFAGYSDNHQSEHTPTSDNKPPQKGVLTEELILSIGIKLPLTVQDLRKKGVEMKFISPDHYLINVEWVSACGSIRVPIQV